jgi:Protein of unknown function (DUF3177)
LAEQCYLIDRLYLGFSFTMAPWISSLVWTDYRLAVLLTVLVPLVMLAASFIQQNEPIMRLMVIYWRVASLLAISAYLLIAAMPVGFVTGWIARLLIPITLWFWVDINESLQDQQSSPLKFSLLSWRWAVSAYCLIGAIAQLPVLRCAFLPNVALLNPSSEPLCYLWMQPTWGFKDMFHPTTTAWFLGGVGLVGLGVYVVYLGVFLFTKLGKHKRSALG